MIHLVKSVVAVFRLPQESGGRIEGQAEAVAASVGKDLVDVRHNRTELREK